MVRSLRAGLAAPPAVLPGMAAALRFSGLLVVFAGCAGTQKPAAPRASAAELEHFHGSAAAQQLGTEGWIVVEELRKDLGGGKEREAIVVEGRLMQGPDPEELRVSIWRPEVEGWKLLGRSEPVPGSSVGLLAPAGCDGERVLYFAAAEEEPDQRRHRLLVFEKLPDLRKSFGVQRDVPAEMQAGFEAEEGGFAFRAGETVERWRCAAGTFSTEPAAPAIAPAAPIP